MFIIRKSEYIIRRICFVFDKLGQEESYSKVPYQKNMSKLFKKMYILTINYKSILITLKTCKIIYFRRNIFKKTYEYAYCLACLPLSSQKTLKPLEPPKIIYLERNIFNQSYS